MSGDHNAAQGATGISMKRDLARITEIFGGLPLNEQGVALGILHTMHALNAAAELITERTRTT